MAASDLSDLVAARDALTGLALRLIRAERANREHLLLTPEFAAALDELNADPTSRDFEFSPDRARLYAPRAAYQQRYSDPGNADAFWRSGKSSARALARLGLGVVHAHARPEPTERSISFLQEQITKAWGDARNASAELADVRI
ncbi:hypothetical protein [Acrocarpospora sp. B8E8]|uniref:hypothetical protein n=1 Tax=Acrocarpospora sp. B8E8 TaxID=3153572 RepID=UPI00325E2FFA